jgi:hypothetical protein
MECFAFREPTTVPFVNVITARLRFNNELSLCYLKVRHGTRRNAIFPTFEVCNYEIQNDPSPLTIDWNQHVA